MAKLITLEQALDLINDGQVIGIGGISLANVPCSIIRGMIKKGLKKLTVVSAVGSIDVDMLVAAGCVDTVKSIYVGFEELCGVGPAFRFAAESKEIKIWECEEVIWHTSIRAASYNIPYMLCKAGVGTDIPKVNKDLEEIQIDGKPWIKVPPTYLDVAIFHTPYATSDGRVLYSGVMRSEWVLARAAKKVIVSCEKLIDEIKIRKYHSLCIAREAYVVHLPFGAHPSLCQTLYRADVEHLKEYISSALLLKKSREPIKKYFDKYIFSCKDHFDYLNKIGIKRLFSLLYDEV